METTPSPPGGVIDPGLAEQDAVASSSSRLTESQIEEITKLLRAGRQLPSYLFPHLFETAREYELSYTGKARRIDVLAETMAVPLQPVRTFGSDLSGWSNMLILGDNLQVLRHLLTMKEVGGMRNPDGSDGVRLCYIDPPFASQREFTGTRNERAYIDRVVGAEFVEHLRRRLILIRELLTDDGALFVHMDTRKVHYIKVVLDEVFGESNFQNEIIWKRTSAHSGARRFGAVHDTLLFYSRSDSYIWNQHFQAYGAQYVAEFYTHVDSENRRWRRSDLTGAGVRHGETGRIWRGLDVTSKGRHWAYPPSELDLMDAAGKIHWPEKEGGMPMLKRYFKDQKGIPAQDVWTDIKPIHNLGVERTGYPTQKPVALVQRIIEAASRPGDIVLDAFVGSGTTLVGAETLPKHRRWIGIDTGKFAIYLTQARLLRHAGKKAPERPFTLYNAGLYDYASLRDLPWQEYLDFVLHLFQCRRAEESIGGVSFQGFLGDHRVLVYPFQQHPGAKIGRAFVKDLAALCRGRLGERCFIVAPALAIEPYEDYLEVDGTRFFFLRIPYSVIAEVHRRVFSELRQPTSEAAANVPVRLRRVRFHRAPPSGV